MNSLFSEDNLQKLEAEDLDELVRYDQAGIILGANENGKELAERLRKFAANNSKLEQAIADGGKYTVDKITVTAKDRIEDKRFAAIAEKTRRLYGFAIDWVQGFYIDPACSLLFGGCAFSQYPDFFTMFIIRRSFREKARWLIYDRDELLAHELCHVARIGLESFAYEESFAYRTSTSAFRRLVGGMFCRPMDSFFFLGSAVLLLSAQVVRTYFNPALSLSPFILIIVGVTAWLLARHIKAQERLLRARLALILAGFCKRETTLKVLFRCSDAEIFTLSRMRSTADAKRWLAEQTDKALRWKVIARRFGPKEVPEAVKQGDFASERGNLVNPPQP